MPSASASNKLMSQIRGFRVERAARLLATRASQLEVLVFLLLLQDWAKAGPCETSLASTLQRRRESVDKMKELEAPPSPQGQPDDPHRARAGPGSMAAKVRDNHLIISRPPVNETRDRALILCVCSPPQHGEPLSPAASTLAMVLTRGLSMEQQKSSRDSLQYSSGYSTQTNTPSCSEDTIPSQGS